MSEHKLTISGKNISIDEYVTPDFARKVIALLYSDNSAIVEAPEALPQKNVEPTADSAVTTTTIGTNDTESDFAIFCKNHDVRRYCEIVLAAGVYLAMKGKESFDIKDYRALFLEYKGTKATNAPSNIEWALDINWITRVDEQSYKVTPAGRRVLNESFPDSVRGSTRGKSKRKAK
ncbi:hypothetical protein WMQ30_22415 [Vibrio diabolicus]|uniref:hypothetical protein n=1 Tax=Vibrio diabolicus TaxID=50719 RepID=UPI003750940C